MFNLNCFQNQACHARDILWSQDDLMEKLAFVTSYEIMDNPDEHLPLFVSLRRGSETIKCVKFGTRYYTITKLNTRLLSLVTTAQGIFMYQNRTLIDDLILLGEAHGETSNSFMDHMLHAIAMQYRDSVLILPSSFIEARCSDLIFAHNIARAMRSSMTSL